MSSETEFGNSRRTNGLSWEQDFSLTEWGSLAGG